MNEKHDKSPRSRACAVCGQVVEAYGTDDRVIGWQHTALTVDDHPVVPVFVDEVRRPRSRHTNLRAAHLKCNQSRRIKLIDTFKPIPGPDYEQRFLGGWGDWKPLLGRVLCREVLSHGPIETLSQIRALLNETENDDEDWPS